MGRENHGNECRGGSVGPYFTCFSQKFDVTNDNSLKGRKIKGVHMKNFQVAGKFHESR